MKEIIGGVVFDVVPWKGGNDIYCYHLNKKVPRWNAWPCIHASWGKPEEHSCINCSLSAEYLYAEKQRFVDSGEAVWITTEDGERLAVQYREYGYKNRKHQEIDYGHK